MKRLRVSIAGLMTIVLIFSLGFAALRNPTVVWASALFTLAVTLFCWAVLGAMANRGMSRLTWAGLAVFGWAYLGIAFGIGSEGNGATPPPFPPQALSDYLRASPSSNFNVQADSRPLGERFIEPSTLIMQGMGKPPTAAIRVDWINQRRIVHSLGAIVFALLGGVAARFLAARNEAAVASSPPTV